MCFCVDSCWFSIDFQNPQETEHRKFHQKMTLWDKYFCQTTFWDTHVGHFGPFWGGHCQEQRRSSQEQRGNSQGHRGAAREQTGTRKSQEQLGDPRWVGPAMGLVDGARSWAAPQDHVLAGLGLLGNSFAGVLITLL